MKKYRYLLFAVCVFFIVLIGCDTMDPLWIGIWVDGTTVSYSTITLEFNRSDGTVTVENTDPDAEAWLTIVTGSLGGDESTLTTTISQIYQESETNPDGITLEEAVLEAYVVTELGLPGLTNTVSYVVKTEGKKTIMELEGPLIDVLTENASNTLRAVKQ
jgi:hypothetical protein